MMRRTSVGLAFLAGVSISSMVSADAAWSGTAPAGQSTSINVALTISSSFGTGNDNETHSHSFAGTATARLVPSGPPFNTITMEALHIDLGPANYAFQFFCIPLFGCQNLGVALAGMTLDLAAPVTSALNASGGASFSAAGFNVVMDYTTSGISTGTYHFITAMPINFAGRFTTTGNSGKFDQMTMSTITFYVDPINLPAGINAITIFVNPTFTNNSMIGPWAPINPADFDSNGVVDGGDMSMMLGAWGASGMTDLNGDGSTDGGDLAMLLSLWG